MENPFFEGNVKVTLNVQFQIIALQISALKSVLTAEQLQQYKSALALLKDQYVNMTPPLSEQDLASVDALLK